MKEVICESCGMPMKHLEDFGAQKIDNKYCAYCSYEDGSLKSWED